MVKVLLRADGRVRTDGLLHQNLYGWRAVACAVGFPTSAYLRRFRQVELASVASG
jgi:hypothetical protein